MLGYYSYLEVLASIVLSCHARGLQTNTVGNVSIGGGELETCVTCRAALLVWACTPVSSAVSAAPCGQYLLYKKFAEWSYTAIPVRDLASWPHNEVPTIYGYRWFFLTQTHICSEILWMGITTCCYCSLVAGTHTLSQAETKNTIHEGNYYIKPTINEQCHSLTHINGIISFHLETSTESTILCGTTHLYTIFISSFGPEVFRFASFYAQHHFLELCTKSQCFIVCSQQSS